MDGLQLNYNISPYAYCPDNPVNAVDPDGKEVCPAGLPELAMIQRTLPVEANYFVLRVHQINCAKVLFFN